MWANTWLILLGTDSLPQRTWRLLSEPAHGSQEEVASRGAQTLKEQHSWPKITLYTEKNRSWFTCKSVAATCTSRHIQEMNPSIFVSSLVWFQAKLLPSQTSTTYDIHGLWSWVIWAMSAAGGEDPGAGCEGKNGCSRATAVM